MYARRTRRAIVWAALLGSLLTVAAVVIGLFTRSADLPVNPPTTAKRIEPDPWLRLDQERARHLAASAAERDAVVERLCSTCHVLPAPDCEPKELWPSKIREMYLYATTARPIQKDIIPDISWPIEYWMSRAPDYLPVPVDAMNSPPSPLEFKRHMITLPEIGESPSVSSVQFVRLTEDEPQLLICDMRYGVVLLWSTPHRNGPTQVLARTPHPSHATVVDLDGDGLLDVLVANLGEYWPADTDQGSIVWVRNLGQGQFETRALAEGLNRVNDIQAADFDGDGDLDLIVGVFGSLETGLTLYMENVTEEGDAELTFESFPLDYRTGTSDVPVVDLNGDGHPDFIALRSQEHEHVIAYINQGQGTFREEMIYQAPHPHWGSTGIRLIDFDGDGDIDVLFNHGDSVQLPPIPRPYHGFAWLENRNTFPFVYHRLANMPGSHTSLPVDLDGDGDLDLVSTAFIPTLNPQWPNTELLDTIVWLEQVSPGEFRRYGLEWGTPYHPCATVGDWDGDGDMDIIVGNFDMFVEKGYVPWSACLIVLENQLRTPDEHHEATAP